VLAEIASRLESQRQVADALRYAERISAEDPLLEHGYRRLMRLHYLRGDRAAALATYDRCRELLGQQLRTRPGKETADLAALIESSAPLAQPAPPPQSVAVLRPPRLIGRDDELLRLAEAHRRCVPALVIGEPGIGKSRLLADFAAAHGDAPILAARPGDAGVPYALLARVMCALIGRFGVPQAAWVATELARIAPELGAAPPGRFDALRLRRAVAQALADWRSDGLALVVLDDLHFADVATLELLPPLAASSDARLTWLLGVRAAETPPAVSRWLAEDDAKSVQSLRLGPLDEPAIRALLESLALPGLDTAALAPALARHTGGNPMFILETLRALLAQGEAADGAARLPAPENVGTLIAHRLEQLSPAALKLARVAAIAGQDFDAELAARVLGQHPLDIADAWRELEDAQVIRDNAFAHDLIYEATLRSVPQAIALVLHKEVATCLEASGSPPARNAQHWEAAGQWAKAGAAFDAAAERARLAGRQVEEVDLLGRAAACHQRAGAEAAHFDALIRQVVALRAVRPLSEVEAAATGVLALAHRPRQRAEALRELGVTQMSMTQWGCAADSLRQAMDAASDAGDNDLYNRARYMRALATAYSQGLEHSIAELDALRNWAENLADEPLKYSFLADFAILLDQGDRRREAVPLFERAIDFFDRAGDVSTAIEARMMLARALSQLGQLVRARELAERAHRGRQELSEGGGGTGIEALTFGRACLELGEYDLALRALEPLEERLGATEILLVRAAVESALARLYLALGQPARATRILRPLPDEIVFHQRAVRLWVRAQLAARVEEKAKLLAEAVGQFSGGHDLAVVRLPIEIDAAAMLPADDGIARCQALVAECDRRELPAAAHHARMRVAQLQLACGRTGEAAASASSYVDEIAACQPSNIYLPQAYWVAYRCFDAAAESQPARDALARARGWIQGRALPHVPASFRDSFLHRNEINRAVLAEVVRVLGA
jgi:tetratricopeptide (TPR) repeat protein